MHFSRKARKGTAPKERKGVLGAILCVALRHLLRSLREMYSCSFSDTLYIRK
jgi:hypothetical protein